MFGLAKILWWVSFLIRSPHVSGLVTATRSTQACVPPVVRLRREVMTKKEHYRCDVCFVSVDGEV